MLKNKCLGLGLGLGLVIVSNFSTLDWAPAPNPLEDPLVLRLAKKYDKSNAQVSLQFFLSNQQVQFHCSDSLEMACAAKD